jgi:hypothetical protein
MYFRTMLFCLAGGLPFGVAVLTNSQMLPLYLSTIVLSAAFLPIAYFGPRDLKGQFAVVAPVLLIVSTLCLWSEGVLFYPASRAHAVRDLVAESVMVLVMAAALAALARLLRLQRASMDSVPRYGVSRTVLGVLAGGAFYTGYYLLFGSVTYRYFTYRYFPDAPRIVAQLGLWFWLIQIARGILMTAAVLPAIYSLRLKRGQAALAIGVLLWVAGGGSQLLVPNPVMDLTQRLIHIVEIMTQNVSLGITAVLLLRPPRPNATGGSLRPIVT